MMTLESFEEASEAVSKVTQETKLVYSSIILPRPATRFILNRKNIQYTGAYKVRGAYYKISTLSEEENSAV